MSDSSIGKTPATGCNSASRESVTHDLQRKLVCFTARVNDLFGVNLTSPRFTGLPVSDLKKFCGGLLEPTGRHPWASELKRIPATDRLSIAGSLFSFRKLLPSSGLDIPSYQEKMSRPHPPTDPRFLRHCRRTVRKLFRMGWDKKWRKFVLSCVPSSSSCLEASRSSGGARGQLVGQREWFLQNCMGLKNHYASIDRKLCLIECAGKQRIVSSSPWDTVLLSPLHRMIYDHLGRFDWLLCGEAEPSSFAAFQQREGDVFVSGDYESATDNLRLDVTKTILSELLGRCSYVPQNIRREALRSLSCNLVAEKEVMQSRGQLMGNFLSFPLLCLQNYIAFTYFCGTDYPVRINGDDIVFRAPRHVYDRWAEGVQSTGLTLSKGKTFVHRRFFCLNSKYFRALRKHQPKVVPIVRASCLRNAEDPIQVTGWVNRVGEGFDALRRDYLQVFVLQKNHKVIRCSQRSLRRGLGMKVNAGVITRSGFRNWEGFYSDLPVESAPPTKTTFGKLPHGWVKISAPLGGVDDPGFGPACVQSAWKVPAQRVTLDDYWDEVRRTSVPCVVRDGVWWRRAARLLGHTVEDTKLFLQPRLAPVRVPKRVWRLVMD